MLRWYVNFDMKCKIVIGLVNPYFSHGKLYIGFSPESCKKMTTLKCRRTENIVHKSLLETTWLNQKFCNILVVNKFQSGYSGYWSFEGD